MHKHILRTITVLAAVAVSGLAVAMAWASAMQRATIQHDQLLLTALGVAVVLAVHLLPALLRRQHPLVLWPVWVLCLALAGFGHASWFYNASQSAAEARQAGSAAAAAVVRERAAIEQTLSTIKARPVATVAAQLARATDPERREALASELAEARRAAGLRDRLVTLSGDSVTRRESSGDGRETAGNTSGGAQESWRDVDVTLVMSVVAAVLVELLGALLWSAALRGEDDAEELAHAQNAPAPTVVQQVVNVLAPVMSRPMHPVVQAAGGDVVDELDDLRAAIARGECRPTVRGIREYLGCKAETAGRLRRALEMQS